MAAEILEQLGQASAAKRRLERFLADISLARGASLRDQVYALLRRAIVTGTLAPGEPINEAEIAAMLGISRTPVREAVRKASDEGLIEVRAQSGTFVADVSRRQVESAYVIRIALELECVKRAAPVIDTPHLHDLEDIVQRHQAAFKRSRYDEALARDDDFHRYIAEITGLSMVWKVIEVSKAQMDRCRVLNLLSPGAGDETISQHRAILNALAARDAEASVAALRLHLDTSLKNTVSSLDAELLRRSRARR